MKYPLKSQKCKLQRLPGLRKTFSYQVAAIPHLHNRTLLDLTLGTSLPGCPSMYTIICLIMKQNM